MMLPARTLSSPNFLTPRRRPAESRPLREEPPAFLWAMMNSVDLVLAGFAQKHTPKIPHSALGSPPSPFGLRGARGFFVATAGAGASSTEASTRGAALAEAVGAVGS